MKIVTGNLWNEEGISDIIFVTTNSTINANRKLVMGRGAALEAAQRYPSLPYELAERIKHHKDGTYGVVVAPQYSSGVQLGAFQVKHHWRDRASLELIKFSTERLAIIAESHNIMRFALNYPGIGNGKLNESDVLPIISSLPDNVIVYKK